MKFLFEEYLTQIISIIKGNFRVYESTKRRYKKIRMFFI